MSLHLKRIEAYRLSLLKEEILEEEEKKIVQEVIEEGDETASTIKYKYESNSDTNAYTDADKASVASATQPGDLGALAALDTVSASEIDTGAVNNSKMADDAIGVAELSATGTPSATTFLRGDNAWETPAGGSSAQPYIQLRRGGAPSTVSTVSGSTSAITWSIETHKDSEFTHDTVTNSEQIQVNETGVYRLQWAIGFAYASSSSSYFRCQPVYRWSILLSVNNFYGSKRTQHQFTQKGNISQNVVISLSSGQYIYAAIYIESSPVSGTMPLTNTECELTLTKID